jgi:hypothetical protein
MQISCTQERKPKQFTLQGGILKVFLVGGNAKHTHLAGCNDLLTFKIIKSQNNCFYYFHKHNICS